MRPEKASIVQEMRGNADESDYIILADFGGLTMEQWGSLRTDLETVNARVQVVKNSLFKVLAGENGWNGLDEALSGPTAMVYGEGDVCAAAKTLKTFYAAHSKLEVKAGVMGETMLSIDQVKELADMPPLKVMQARLAATLAAPMQQLASVANQKVLSVIYVLQAAASK